ncbi:MAG: HDIG domain-containing protein [Flavobacteriales bacterium]|nr:HDIG domain-containing protein [Flavobacteriales bacterium]
MRFFSKATFSRASIAEWMNSVRDRHDEILSVALFVLCWVGLVMVYPREVRFSYEFENGAPWRYEDYYAPFDVDVMFLEEELAERKVEALSDVQPMLRREAGAREAVERALELLPETWADRGMLAEKVRSRMEAVRGEVDRIFDLGVVDRSTVPDHFGREVLVMGDGLAREVSLNALHDLESARAALYAGWPRLGDMAMPGLGLVSDALKENLRYDPDGSDRLAADVVAALEVYAGKLPQGARVVQRGERLSLDTYRELHAIRTATLGGAAESAARAVLWGQLLLVLIGLIATAIALHIFSPETLSDPRRVAVILALYFALALLTKVVLSAGNLAVHLVPMCILPLVIRSYLDRKLAMVLHVIFVLMVSFMVPSAYEFAFLQAFAGILLLYFLHSATRRSEYFNAAIAIFASYSMTHFGLSLVQQGGFEGMEGLDYAWFGGNALLCMLAFPLVYFFERSLGLLTDIRLLEISDTNNPLLRELAENAPGTFQHSVQVANLAEDATRAIGGNALLVRAGALYHDIGKMQHPHFFIENQQGFNPHDEIDPEESTLHIIGHVSQGIERAKNAGLPDEVIDFIRTHHGTSLVRYFYQKALSKAAELAAAGGTPAGEPSPQISPSNFRYPGPLPYSKETAVLMMADSVEAAARALPQVTDERIGELVDRLLKAQLDDGQFASADITFREIQAVARVLKRRLRSIHHQRIAYQK